MDHRVNILARDRAEATWGVGEPWTYYIKCLVEDGGDVLVWDEIGDSYTRLHHLTADQQARARAVAASGQRFERGPAAQDAEVE